MVEKYSSLKPFDLVKVVVQHLKRLMSFKSKIYSI